MRAAVGEEQRKVLDRLELISSRRSPRRASGTRASSALGVRSDTEGLNRHKRLPLEGHMFSDKKRAFVRSWLQSGRVFIVTPPRFAWLPPACPDTPARAGAGPARNQLLVPGAELGRRTEDKLAVVSSAGKNLEMWSLQPA